MSNYFCLLELKCHISEMDHISLLEKFSSLIGHFLYNSDFLKRIDRKKLFNFPTFCLSSVAFMLILSP
jgi:hypothetical protein